MPTHGDQKPTGLSGLAGLMGLAGLAGLVGLVGPVWPGNGWDQGVGLEVKRWIKVVSRGNFIITQTEP